MTSQEMKLNETKLNGKKRKIKEKLNYIKRNLGI